MNSETLQKLLDDGLAVMEPNNPAKPYLRACLTAAADTPGQSYSLYFYDYRESATREARGYGYTPETALDEFRAKYQPPLTVAGKIAALRAESAKLEASLS